MKSVAVLDGDVVVNIVLCADDHVLNNNELVYTELNPAYIGGDYVDGKFYPPKPYSKWVRDNGNWVAPIPYPDPDHIESWSWDDENGLWVK